METSNKKKVIQSTIGTIFGAVIILIIQQTFFKAPSFDKVMMEAASELNKSCPMMVDSDTQLDNAIALPGNIFQYNYTLVNYTLAEIDVDNLEENLEPVLINNVKTNPDMSGFRKNSVTVAYNYKDKEGNFITKISVTKDDYQ